MVASFPNTKGGTYYGICTNANSIGIEMCIRNKGNKSDTSKDWYFEEATVESAIALTKELMAKYHVLGGNMSFVTMMWLGKFVLIHMCTIPKSIPGRHLKRRLKKAK